MIISQFIDRYNLLKVILLSCLGVSERVDEGQKYFASWWCLSLIGPLRGKIVARVGVDTGQHISIEISHFVLFFYFVTISTYLVAIMRLSNH